MRIRRDALDGAAKAALLGFFLSGWSIGIGPKFAFETWSWVASYCLFIAVGSVIGVLTGSRHSRLEREQSASAARTAADLGLTYLPTVERPPLALPCFKKWHSGKEGNVGEVGGVPVSVFDMVEQIETFEGTGFFTRTIVLLPADGVPAFTASPCRAGRFAHLLELGGTRFDPATAPAGAADTVRQFGRSFRIECPGNPSRWTLTTQRLQKAEEPVRRLMTPKLMAALLAWPGWSFQTGAGSLVCWRGQSVCPAGKRQEWIAAASAIQAALLAAVADMSVVAPPVP